MNRAPSRPNIPVAIWLCICDCGKTKEIRSSCLVRGHTKSCGCLRGEKAAINGMVVKLDFPLASQRTLFRLCKRRSKKIDHIFNISFDDFITIIRGSCYYCGQKPSNIYRLKGSGDFLYSGIDRAENSKGYTLENVVPCCKICNFAKGTLSKNEFLDWVKKIYIHQKGKMS